MSREAVHEWSVQWVENADARIDDGMVSTALQALHGFDMTYQFDVAT
jgi:hypothetical protein